MMQNAEALDAKGIHKSCDDNQAVEIPTAQISEKLRNIHKIPSQPITIPSTVSSIQPSIKLNNNMEKIQYSLINNWIENGFIENMRGQIRCQLIKELKNPFKHQQNGGLQKLESTNHLSLSRRILNSIIIDYLSHYSYNYSLSIFKSEIGGELIGSLSCSDTFNQLNLRESSNCILEQLMDATKANLKLSEQNTINLLHKTNEKQQQLAMETKRVRDLSYKS